MRDFLIVLVAYACSHFSFCGAALQAKPAYKNESYLQLDKRLVDFGEIEAGTTKVHQFNYWNRGPSTLHVTAVHTPCGCTKVEVSNSSLAPGESGFLKVAFNSAGFKGPVLKTLVLISDDTILPSQVLTIKAHVKKGIWFEPIAFDLGSVNIDEDISFLAHLKTKKGLQLDSKFLSFNKDVMSLKGFAPKEGGVAVEFTLTPRELGPGKQVVRYNQGGLDILLPVKYTSVSATRWTPGYIEFGSLKQSKEITRTVALSNMPNNLSKDMLELDIKVNGKKVNDHKDFIEYDLQKTGNASYQLKLKLKHTNSELSGGLLGRVSIKNKIPKGKSPVQLKFYGFLI